MCLANFLSLGALVKETWSNIIKVPGGSGGSLLSPFKKSVVSWIIDGSEIVSGCKKQSTKCKIFFVWAPFRGTIGPTKVGRLMNFR